MFLPLSANFFFSAQANNLKQKTIEMWVCYVSTNSSDTKIKLIGITLTIECGFFYPGKNENRTESLTELKLRLCFNVGIVHKLDHRFFHRRFKVRSNLLRTPKGDYRLKLTSRFDGSRWEWLHSIIDRSFYSIWLRKARRVFNMYNFSLNGVFSGTVFSLFYS